MEKINVTIEYPQREENFSLEDVLWKEKLVDVVNQLIEKINQLTVEINLLNQKNEN